MRIRELFARLDIHRFTEYGKPRMTEHELRTALGLWVTQYASQVDAAKRLRLSAPMLNMILRGYRRVPERIARRLGYKRETRLVRLAHDKTEIKA